ncbi:hypothetical protein JOC54_003224 [Alkalihalobacillus xiaoxiensis]|uniref:DUF998 domain-containing protein n=1 Tax=Shouchella xiaoxiensis TaxID=766895 RepID=A0ABS2SWM9_9BACI|nr:hypothetical protein [Shouchella xiaoxiensis]MBM7839944.1 hypothetical protein [Shouchella xiaoxiensis]
MGNRIRKDIVLSMSQVYRKEKWFVWLGGVGIGLAIMALAVIYVRGAQVAPEGNMADVFSFSAAVGIFLLSLAVVYTQTEFNTKSKQRIRFSIIGIILYFYAIEFVQHYRGINPRFTSEGSILDMVLGGIFGMTSLLLIVLLMIISIHFWKMRQKTNDSLLKLSIRYALFSILLANSAGLAMVALQGRYLGDSGNFIVLHGAGFHALQSLLIIAWLLERSTGERNFIEKLLKTGCIAWTSAIMTVAIQTGLGRTIFELSPLPILAMICVSVWFVVLCIAIVMYAKSIKRNKEASGNWFKVSI